MVISPVQNVVTSAITQSTALSNAPVAAPAGIVAPSTAKDVALVQDVSGHLIEASGLYNATLDLAGLNSQVTVAQSGTQQIADILQNLWNIAQQITRGGNGSSVDTLETQFQILYSQISQAVADSSFGGSSLLDGSFTLDNTPLAGTQTASIVPNLSPQGLFGNTQPDVSTAAGVNDALDAIVGAQAIVSGAGSSLDTLGKQVNFAIASIATAQANNEASTSVINDGEFGGLISTLLAKPQLTASTQGAKLSDNVFGLLKKAE